MKSRSSWPQSLIASSIGIRSGVCLKLGLKAERPAPFGGSSIQLGDEVRVDRILGGIGDRRGFVRSDAELYDVVPEAIRHDAPVSGTQWVDRRLYLDLPRQHPEAQGAGECQPEQGLAGLAVIRRRPKFGGLEVEVVEGVADEEDGVVKKKKILRLRLRSWSASASPPDAEELDRHTVPAGLRVAHVAGVRKTDHRPISGPGLF